MYYFMAALAGIGGTALMTGFVYFISWITKNDFKVVKILGRMITNRTGRKSIMTGMIAHYLIGVFFAVIYAWLWSRGIGSPTISSGLVFGAANGLFAMLFWFTFIKLHPNPPAVKLPAYLIVIGVGHLFFSTGVVLWYL